MLTAGSRARLAIEAASASAPCCITPSCIRKKHRPAGPDIRTPHCKSQPWHPWPDGSGMVATIYHRGAALCWYRPPAPPCLPALPPIRPARPECNRSQCTSAGSRAPLAHGTRGNAVSGRHHEAQGHGNRPRGARLESSDPGLGRPRALEQASLDRLEQACACEVANIPRPTSGLATAAHQQACCQTRAQSTRANNLWRGQQQG